MDPARFFCEWLSTKPACCFPLAHPLTKTYRDAYLCDSPSPGKFAADFRDFIPKTDSVKYKENYKISVL